MNAPSPQPCADLAPPDHAPGPSFALIGTYDVDNYGDCLFPQVYAALIRQRVPSARFTCYSPFGRAARIGNIDRVRALPERLDDAALSEDIAILTGGETIGVGHGTGTYAFPLATLSAFLRLWLAPLREQRKAGRVFAANCVGAVGLGAQDRLAVGRLLAAASFVSFRDAFSAEAVSDAETRFPVMVDPMYMIAETHGPGFAAETAARAVPAPLLRQGYLACQISDPYLGDLDAWTGQVAQAAKATASAVALTPICHFLGDAALLRIAQRRLAASGVTCAVVGADANVDVTTAIIAASRGYLGSSLHGAVTAVSFGLPLAVSGKSASGKHKGTLGAVGLADRVCTSMSGLADAFLRAARAGQSDAAGARARDAARRDFDRFLAAVLSVRDRSPVDLDPEALRHVLACDVARGGTGALAGLRRAKARALMLAPAAMMAYRRLRIAARHGLKTPATAHGA